MPSPRTPLLTVDAIISGKESHEIILIKRKYPPIGWALPGGFVDIGESVETAIAREAYEETTLIIKSVSLFGVYSDPKRDSRFHTVSIVFTAETAGIPHGNDDAAHAAFFRLEKLPTPIVFDHRQIINDYRAYLTDGLSVRNKRLSFKSL